MSPLSILKNHTTFSKENQEKSISDIFRFPARKRKGRHGCLPMTIASHKRRFQKSKSYTVGGVIS